MTSLEQKERDNEALYFGMVNRCVGSLQLSPISLEQVGVAAVGFVIAVFVWLMWSIEVAITTFAIFALTFVTLGGRDFGREYEKLQPTRTYYNETPAKTTAADGFPAPLFEGDDYILSGPKNDERLYSIERAFKNLRFYGSYERHSADAGFYALNQGYGALIYFVYGFEVAGFSPCMDHRDCMAAIRKINRAFKNLPDLKLKFIWDIPADASAQILQQKRLLEQAEQDNLTVEIVKSRGQWATRAEKRGDVVAPTLRVYARVRTEIGQENVIPQDWKDRWLAKPLPLIRRWFGEETQQALFDKAVDYSYDACCRPVLRAFNERMGIKARSLTVHELYGWDFAQLHETPVDKCPQFIRFTDDGIFEHEAQDEQGQPLVPHHILGELFKSEGIPSTPAFYRSDLWFPLKGRLDGEGNPIGRFAACVRLTQMEGYAEVDESHAIGHLQNAYHWMTELSDVQFITEVEAIDPKINKNKVDKGITNRTKRSNRAITKQTQDVDSMEDVEDLVEARRLFRSGERTLSTATLIWVYSHDRDQLKLKTQQVMERIGKDNCELVQDSIEYRWFDSQPYAWEAICNTPINRRQEYMIPQAIPLIPFTQPQQLDRKGIGYIGKGISAQYFIDYCGQKNHTFIGAKSGGGKSMQGLGILAQCIATRTPSLFLDSPPIADAQTGKVAPSTYTPAINVWRAQKVPCAYHDIKKQDFNIIGRYGFGKNRFEIDALVESHLDTLQAAVIGDNPRHPLAESVKNILSLSYSDFLRQTLDASQDPILEDYLRYYIPWSQNYLSGDVDLYSIIGVDGLGKFEPSEDERRAIGMIRSQLIGILAQPWGRRINAQTSFDTDVLHLVLGLTNIKEGSKEGLVYALAALSFMDRITSKYTRSVAGMDEGSTLLPMEAFAAKFHRLFPEGRKKGLNGFLIATELDSLWNSPYCGKILDNFDNTLVGYSEDTSVKKFVERLGFKEEILRRYTEAPDLTTMSSQWYLKRGSEHLELLYYTTPMLLGLGATGTDELTASAAFREPYSEAELINSYKDFGQKLFTAYTQGRGPKSVLKVAA